MVEAKLCGVKMFIISKIFLGPSLPRNDRESNCRIPDSTCVHILKNETCEGINYKWHGILQLSLTGN